MISNFFLFIFFEFQMSVYQQSSFIENCWLLKGISNFKCNFILGIKHKKCQIKDFIFPLEVLMKLSTIRKKINGIKCERVNSMKIKLYLF